MSVSFVLFAQADRGTITGTVSDPAGAVVAGAPIELKNTETGAIYTAASTATGNYTVPQLPAGSYEMSVTVPGFKKYVRQNIDVQVAQTLRLDLALEVGAATESVTVSAEVTLLKTESGEMSHNVATERVNNLPIMSTGAAAGSSGIRNPQAVAQLVPGTYVAQNSNFRVNGAPGNTASYRVEGQDASNAQVPATQAQTQPSVDAIQEVTIQTSNFAAEYGQVGGGFLNYTMKSGTNQLHGSAYDYWVNEALNASTPWLNTKNRARRHNYGFTIGGPVVLPKLYDGRDKTFFFFNFEQFRENQNISNQALTLPVAEYRQGDFRRALNRNLGVTDPLGRPIIENTIYDPATTRLVNGQPIRDPFPNNTIPQDRMDPVALKIQSLIPATTRAGLINNAIFPYDSQRVTDIPAVKMDHNISSRAKISYYWSQTRTASQYSPTFGASDGLPTPITAAIGTFITARTQRVNFDYTLSPTVLLHIGGGFQSNRFSDDAPVLDFNQETALGLKGATVQRLFPALQFPASQPQGGMKNMGPAGNRHPLLYEKPTGNYSLTWVTGNHTYKFGGEIRLDSNFSSLYTFTNGIYTFAPNQTSLTYNQSATFGTGGTTGTVGFPYASFLLGAADTVRIAPLHEIKLAKKQLGFFVQDTWKATRKLTVDYGLRYDWANYLREVDGKLAQFSPTTPNPSIGGRPGAVIFEGEGPNRCNCSFAKAYPWAFGPRLGVAYQINPKTVFRAGWGIVYAGTTDANGATQGGLTAPEAVNNPSFGEPLVNLRTGIPSSLVRPFPNFDAGQYPTQGLIQSPLVWYDQNAGRPARQMQWSVGLQREIGANFVVEAAYVGNRGAWWYAPGLVDVNALTPERLAAFGLDPTVAADRTILTSQVRNPGAGRFQNVSPYPGFPVTSSVAQSLRPFPQFNSINALWSPLGNTWYDSLQAKATKRLTRGLTFTSVFTWQKSLLSGAPSNPVVPGTGGVAVNDVFNRKLNKAISPFDQPFVFNIAASYTVPKFIDGDGMAMKAASLVTRDWALNVFMAYSSGLPILAPSAQTNLNTLLLRNVAGTQTGYVNRVPGVSPFLQDLNCNCYDPNKEFVLNPAAWSAPAPGTFGNASAYYSDYRFQRRPQENVGIGRIFRIRERMSLNVRAEFTNIFNRSVIPNPTGTAISNAGLGQTRNTAGVPTAGFGFINTAVAPTIPTSRQGTIVARFNF